MFDRRPASEEGHRTVNGENAKGGRSPTPAERGKLLILELLLVFRRRSILRDNLSADVSIEDVFLE